MLASVLIIVICSWLMVYWFVMTTRLIRRLRDEDERGKPSGGSGNIRFLMLALQMQYRSLAVQAARSR
jgi:hypothetical protein